MKHLLVTLFIFIYASFVFQIEDPLFLLGWISTIVLIVCLYKSDSFKLSIQDILIIFLLLYQAISIFTGINNIPSFVGFISFYLATIWYFIVRFSFRKDFDIKSFLVSISLFSTFFLLFGFFSFLKLKGNLSSINIFNISSFKHLLQPLGMPLNLWANFLINVIAIQVLSLYYTKNNQWTNLFLFIGTLFSTFLSIITFSRGVYICLIFLFLFAFIFFIVKNKVKKNILFVVLATLLIPTIYPYENDIKETLKINGTISQKRSLEGRLEIGKVAIDIYKKQPICGIGLNNFSQAANRQLYENDNVPFTSFSGSIIYQTVAEQGTIGSVLIILLFLSVLHTLFCNIKKEIAWILLLCFVMIMTKELTFPSVFSSSSHLLLLFVLLALKENVFTNKWIIKLPRKNILMLLLVLTSGTIAFFLIRHKKNEEYNQSFIVEMNKGNINKAINQIEKANNDTPYLINKGLAYWYLYKYKSESAALKKSESFFLRALQKSTEDPCLLYNMATIYYADGQIERSKEIMDLLIKNYPHKSLFWLTAFWYSLDNSTVNIDYLINAIELNPNILESSYFQLITNIDSSIYKDIKTVLTYQENELDPIQSAKYGKLLFLLGDTLNAKCQLEYSLSRLPNLSEPYLSLSIIEEAQGKHILSGLYLKKYELLNKYTKNKEKDVLLKHSYNAKFGLWYGSRTFSDGIIHPFD